jgi:hypothetical protein
MDNPKINGWYKPFVFFPYGWGYPKMDGLIFFNTKMKWMIGGVSVGIHWCFEGFFPFNVVVLSQSKCRELLPGRGLAFTLGPTCSTNWRCLLGISATLAFEIPTGSAHHPRILKSMAISGTDSLHLPYIRPISIRLMREYPNNIWPNIWFVYIPSGYIT